MSQASRIDFIVPGIMLLAMVLPAFTSNGYYLHTVSMSAIGIVLALSLNLLYGYAGQISFGHAGFYALGAYSATLLQTRLQFSFPVALIATLVIVFVLAAVAGWPILRLKGYYLGMATLAFGLLIFTVLLQWIDFSGGPSGISVPPATLFGIELGDGFYHFILGVAIAVYLFCVSLSWSRVGMALRALEGDESAAAAAGIDTAYYKILVFALSGSIAGLAGVLYAHLNLFIAPEVFSLHTSILILIMVVVGGLGSNPGVSIGAVLFTLLPQLLDRFEDYNHLFYGAILLACLIYLPRGLASLVGAGRANQQGVRG